MESSNNDTDANTLIAPRKRVSLEPEPELMKSKRERVGSCTPSLEEKIGEINDEDDYAVVFEKGEQEEEVVQEDKIEFAEEVEADEDVDHDAQYEEADYTEEEVEEPVMFGRRTNIYCHPREIFKDQLMLSQWLLEEPNDLKTNWIFLPCPKGKRNLVIAADGATRNFSKNGALQHVFPSHLPGGCRMQGWTSCVKSFTVLDCVYSEANKMFYILDMMCWDGFSYYDCPTELRMMMLDYKMNHLEEVGRMDRVNPYRFKRLEFYDWSGGYVEEGTFKYSDKSECNGKFYMPGIQDILGNTEPLPFEANDDLDGILLYNREAIYESGETKEVKWIKAFMAPEVMGGIHISENLLKQKPSDYKGIQDYVQIFNKEAQERKRKEAEKKKKKIEWVREKMMKKMEAEVMKIKYENGTEVQLENVGVIVDQKSLEGGREEEKFWKLSLWLEAQIECLDTTFCNHVKCP